MENFVDKNRKQELDKLCRQFRIDLIEMLHQSQSGHPGSSLSVAEIMTTLYFEKMMGLDAKKPSAPGRDRFVLSKGHAAPMLYIILAELGYFPKEDLMTLRQLGSHLQGHPNIKTTSGIDYSSAPLGQGLSVGLGMSLSAKMKNWTILLMWCSATGRFRRALYGKRQWLRLNSGPTT